MHHSANHRRSSPRVNRRACLEIGASSALGLSWPALLQGATAPADEKQFGKAKSCVVIFLFGGPSQQDLWDMKPDADAEFRGEFAPVSTNVPGTQIGDQLPHLSRQADKFTIIRSMRHADFEHGSASFTALTGQPHPKPGTNTPAQPDDFPNMGSLVTLRKKIDKPVPEAVVLGPVMHQGARPPMAGQNGGFLGRGYDPFRIAGDPNKPDFAVTGLQAPPDVTSLRLDRRRSLLDSFNTHLRHLDETRAVESMDHLFQRAHGLLRSTQSQRAFDLSREDERLRDRYGRHTFGQTLLLARRLVEAEVPLVQVNWSKLNADQWDTHKKNYSRLRELLPPFDQGLAAFYQDLGDRGLLDTTMVIVLGEFGRTPKMNKDAGRDHWPDCYSLLIGGGGVARGQVFGKSDERAAYPVTAPVGPWDVAATAFNCLGVDPHANIHDRQGRPYHISPGRILTSLL